MQEQTFTIKVAGRVIPTSFVRVLTHNDTLPVYHSEITGPERAFEFRAGSRFDKVKVVQPELVEIKTLRAV